MFSNDEKKQLRKDFWNRFAERTKAIKNKRGYSKKWMLYKTGVKGVELKFHLDEKTALVMIEINLNNAERRDGIFNIIEEYKAVLETAFKNPLIWDKDVYVTDKKQIARIYYEMKPANIYIKDQWPEIIDFFVRQMTRLEFAWREYADVIKERTKAIIQ